MEYRESWRNISVREKWQIINGTVLVFAAIALYFVSFAITLTIGMTIVSASGTMLATGLAFFGITSYIKNQMVNFEAKVEQKVKRLEDIEQERKFEGYGRYHKDEEVH